MVKAIIPWPLPSVQRSERRRAGRRDRVAAPPSLIRSSRTIWLEEIEELERLLPLYSGFQVWLGKRLRKIP
jgi:hypothetical protein